MRHLIALFIVVIFAGRSFGMTAAQTDSANELADVTTNKPPSWSGTITLGLTATEGNNNSVLATTKILVNKKAPRDEWHLGADGTYGEADSVKNAESAHAFGQYNHTFIDDTWYGYARTEAWHDAIADVTYRVASGLGAGYYFIKDKQTTLSSEVGPAVEIEKLDDERHIYPTVRVAENFERKIDGHARVWEDVEVLPPLTDPDAFLVNAEVGVETPLTHSISLQTYLQDNFANEPAPGFKDNDIKLVSGVVFKF